MSYLKNALSPQNTTQREPLNDRMAPNNAGGYSFTADDWARLERFLILGTESGTYYVDEKKLTVQNVDVVKRCLAVDGKRVVDTIVDVSVNGRAPKNDTALLALAAAAKLGDDETRRLALLALPSVARIGTHLFHFMEFIQLFGGWGRGTRTAVGNWYRAKSPNALANQVVKYRQRDGWTHRDALRLSHPIPTNELQREVFNWVTKGWDAIGDEPHPDQVLRKIWAFERAQKLGNDPRRVAALITEYGLPREAVPTEALNSPEVWLALLKDMPLTAMLRNLATMTRIGVLTPYSQATAKVMMALSDTDAVRAARIHPIQVLSALRTYASGQSVRGDNTWTPVPMIIDTLNLLFYAAFQNIPTSDKTVLCGVDISGSMFGSQSFAMFNPRDPYFGWARPTTITQGTLVNGIPGFSCLEAASAMAMALMTAHPLHQVIAFSEEPMETTVSKGQRLDDVMKAFASMPHGGTDCSAPIRYAIAKGLHLDAIVILTDSETWSGRMHPVASLQEYRRRYNQSCKLVNIAMTANHATIADNQDPLTLECVGFDTNVPALVHDFLGH